MRSRRALALLACAAVLLGACGSDKKGNNAIGSSTKNSEATTPTSASAGPPDNAKLAPINLQKADFPPEWTVQESAQAQDADTVERGILQCADVTRTFNPVRSPEFGHGKGDLSATSSVVEAPSEGTAKQDFKGFAAEKFVGCAQGVIKTAFSDQMAAQQATVQSQSFEKISFPSVGSELLPFRFKATLAAQGQTLSIDLLYLFLRQGDIEVNLQFAGFNMAFPQDLATQLAKSVDARAKAA